ncbi:MAG: hypothetical protein JXA03_06090 [Bacteroidales bacterium]|nr:hypothetical protein [Bacteroidales bacterium]
MSKRYENIDDLFREKFNDFELEPPAHIWVNVEKSIKDSGTGSGGKAGRGGIVGFSALLIGLGGLLVFFTHPRNRFSEESLLAAADFAVEEVAGSRNENPGTTATHDFNDQPVMERDGSVTGTTNPDPVSVQSLPDHSQAGVSIVPANSNVIAVNNSIKPSGRQEDFSGSYHEAAAGYLRNLLPGQIDNEYSLNAGRLNSREAATHEYFLSNGITARSSLTGFSENGERSGNAYVTKHRWSFGLFFIPESVIYPDDNDIHKRSYSIDLHAMMNNEGFILQSGLGVAFSEDNGDYTVNYEKYLGSYEDVYDITFDSASGGVIPVYHTQTVEVYDSTRYVSISETKNRYTYLQLPVFIGYGLEHKRVTWSVKAGPSVSLLMSEKIPGINFPGKDIRVIGIDEKVPERIRLHWQIIFSAGMSYKLSNRVNLVFEPVFRYYIKSAYGRNTIQTKHPYSYGIRTGLTINF